MIVAIPCDPSNPGEMLACYGLLAALDQDTPPHLPAPLGHFRLKEEVTHFIIEFTMPDSFPAWVNTRRPTELVPMYQESDDKLMPIQVTDASTRRTVMDWWLRLGTTPVSKANVSRRDTAGANPKKTLKNWQDEDCSAWKLWGGQLSAETLLTTLMLRLNACDVPTDITQLFSLVIPNRKKEVADFGFDARSQRGAYNTGFKLTKAVDAHKDRIAYFPWTTWFAILGLQAWHPTMPCAQWRYRCWTQPLPAALARWPLQNIDRLGWASGPRFQARVYANGKNHQLGFSQRISSEEEFLS